MNKALTGGVVLAVVLSGLAFFSAPSDTITERVVERVGAVVGPEYQETQNFRAGFTVGNQNTDYATTSTASAYTLTALEVDTDIPYVAWNAGLNVTLTLPNATSAPFTKLRVGESFEQLWYSSTSTTATTITFAENAGNGVDLQEDEGGSVILNGLETGRITYIKTGASAVSVIVEPYQVGD